MFDMMKMMGKMKEVQARMKEAQDNLGKLRVQGESGAGLVKATVTSKKQIVAMEIDTSLLEANDKVILQDLIIAAVNKANEESAKRMSAATAGMPIPPGMKLPGMF